MGQAERNKGATWVQALWHLGDLLAIGAGFLLGYWTRFDSPLTRLIPVEPEKGIPPLSLYLGAAAVTALVWIPLYHAQGLYRLERGRPRHKRGTVVRAQFFGITAVVALSFFYRDDSFSRVAVPLIWLFTVAWTLALRAGIAAAVRRLRWLRPIRFAVVGDGPTAQRVARSLAESSYPHRFDGCFLPRLDAEEASGGLRGVGGTGLATPPADARPGVETAPCPSPPEARPTRGGRPPRSEPAVTGSRVLGDASEIRRVAPALDLDLVVLAATGVSPGLVQEVYSQCQALDLDFLFVPELSSVWGRRVRVEEVDGLPLIRLRDLSLVGWNGVLKRALDLAVSVPLLLVCSPVFAILAAAVRLDSPGPVFHSQERIGRDRRPFRMVKFRSMRADAEAQSGPIWARSDDPRRTRVGGFLRRWSLDELPQLWNVVRGQMSLVGPRPERPHFVHRFEEQVADYYDRHRVKSGMTGWAQVHGHRGDTPIEERTQLDLYYVENWSIWLDLRILAMTAWAVFRHRGA